MDGWLLRFRLSLCKDRLAGFYVSVFVFIHFMTDWLLVLLQSLLQSCNKSLTDLFFSLCYVCAVHGCLTAVHVSVCLGKDRLAGCFISVFLYVHVMNGWLIDRFVTGIGVQAAQVLHLLQPDPVCGRQRHLHSAQDPGKWVSLLSCSAAVCRSQLTVPLFCCNCVHPVQIQKCLSQVNPVCVINVMLIMFKVQECLYACFVVWANCVFLQHYCFHPVWEHLSFVSLSELTLSLFIIIICFHPIQDTEMPVCLNNFIQLINLYHWLALSCS